MYTVSGTLGIKIFQGQIIRHRSSFKQFLNTPEGVLEYVKDMRPFTEIKITDKDGKDVTSEFIDVNEVK